MTPRTRKIAGFTLIAAALLTAVLLAVRHVPLVTYKARHYSPKANEHVMTMQVGTDWTFYLVAGVAVIGGVLALRPGRGDPDD